jgi:hypothetical protein
MIEKFISNLFGGSPFTEKELQEAKFKLKRSPIRPELIEARSKLRRNVEVYNIAKGKVCPPGKKLTKNKRCVSRKRSTKKVKSKKRSVKRKSKKRSVKRKSKKRSVKKVKSKKKSTKKVKSKKRSVKRKSKKRSVKRKSKSKQKGGANWNNLKGSRWDALKK